MSLTSVDAYVSLQTTLNNSLETTENNTKKTLKLIEELPKRTSLAACVYAQTTLTKSSEMTEMSLKKEPHQLLWRHLSSNYSKKELAREKLPNERASR